MPTFGCSFLPCPSFPFKDQPTSSLALVEPHPKRKNNGWLPNGLSYTKSCLDRICRNQYVASAPGTCDSLTPRQPSRSRSRSHPWPRRCGSGTAWGPRRGRPCARGAPRCAPGAPPGWARPGPRAPPWLGGEMGESKNRRPRCLQKKQRKMMGVCPRKVVQMDAEASLTLFKMQRLSKIKGLASKTPANHGCRTPFFIHQMVWYGLKKVAPPGTCP